MKEEMLNPLSDIIMYHKPDGTVNVEILVQDETLWMQQSRICILFMIRQEDRDMRFGIIRCKMQGYVDEYIWNDFVDGSLGIKEAQQGSLP